MQREYFRGAATRLALVHSSCSVPLQHSSPAALHDSFFATADLTKELPSPRYQSQAVTEAPSTRPAAAASEADRLPSIAEPRPPADRRGDVTPSEHRAPHRRAVVPRRAGGPDGEARLRNVEVPSTRSSAADVRSMARAEAARGDGSNRRRAGVPPSPYTPSSKSYGAHYLAHERSSQNQRARQDKAHS